MATNKLTVDTKQSVYEVSKRLNDLKTRFS